MTSSATLEELDQKYLSFSNMVISSTEKVKELHAKYVPFDPVPIMTCEAMVRELNMAKEKPEWRMRPSWEFYRDCIGVKDLIEDKKEEFFLDGARRIRRKEYLRADIGPIWNLLSQSEKDDLWKQFRRILKLAIAIHNLTPLTEQQRLLRNWP